MSLITLLDVAFFPASRAPFAASRIRAVQPSGTDSRLPSRVLLGCCHTARLADCVSGISDPSTTSASDEMSHCRMWLLNSPQWGI